MSLEHEILRDLRLHLEALIEDFAKAKARKVAIV
jgi:hypothetical protein